jgi:hypothetical protein
MGCVKDSHPLDDGGQWEKQMRFLKRVLIVGCLLGAAVSHAATYVWSSCQAIAGVSNYIACSNQLVLALSPGISGCSGAGIAGGVGFIIGTDGVTSTNIDSFLASSLAAYHTGTQVMILYDTSVTGCAGAIISAGGYSGQY